MLKQGQLTTDMSPTKPVKDIKHPVRLHVLSTPAHTSNKSDVPPLNWDLSIIRNVDESMINEKKTDVTDRSNESIKKSRRKPVEIKSRYMQSATKKRSPAVNNITVSKTPNLGKAPGSNLSKTTIGKTPLTTNSSSNRQQMIEELNREDTFTFEKKKPVPQKPTSTQKTTATQSKTKPTIKQSIGSDRKALRNVAKDIISGTPNFGRKTSQHSRDWSLDVEEQNSHGSNQSNSGYTAQPALPPEPKDKDVTEIDLQILECQKLQMLYLLDNLQSTQQALSDEAGAQIYQMWKVQENLRSDCASLEKEALVKDYICEVNELCESLLPMCNEFTNLLPKFDKQFVTLCEMLDSTRHFIQTVQIARIDRDQIEDLQKSLKQVLEMLQSIYYDAADDKENLAESAKELKLLKDNFETSSRYYDNAVKIAQKINDTTNNNMFLTSALSKIDTSRTGDG